MFQGIAFPDLEFISIADFKLSLIGFDIPNVFHLYSGLPQLSKKKKKVDLKN